MKKTCLTLILLLLGIMAGAQSNYKLQSIFLYNFTRLFAWPEGYQVGDFIIGVYGDCQIIPELQQLKTTRKAGNQNLEIIVFKSISDITRCHMLYIPTSENRKTEEIVNHIKKKQINALIVTDARNATKAGSVINFLMLEGGQKFELSLNNAGELGLIAGGEISRLAILIE
jgi:hypothetical protein